MDIFAVTLSGVLDTTLAILQFVVGLGLVVFVHELGHFLVAKWVGIKVERFALGFGPRLLRYRPGETEYCFCAIPLGGYIKMLGQEDFAPLTEGTEADPRSYSSKSVGARFAVIAAGVIMNVIFAAILFVVVGLVGKDFTAPVVGGVVPDYPASEMELAWQPAESSAQTQPASRPTSAPTAEKTFGPGLRPEDRILQVNGRSIEHFGTVDLKSLLADPEDTFAFLVERRDPAGRLWHGRGSMGVRKAPDGKKLMFGLFSSADVVVDRHKEIRIDSPFQKNDRILAIDDKRIERFQQIIAIEQILTGRPVRIQYQRGGEVLDVEVQPLPTTAGDVFWLTDGRRLTGRILAPDEDPDENAVPMRLSDGNAGRYAKDLFAGRWERNVLVRESLDVLGMQPRFAIASVSKGSPADKAGIQPGDVIVNYGDHSHPTFQEIRQINERLAGSETHVEILRDEKTHGIRLAPKQRDIGAVIGVTNGIDLAHTVLGDVRAGSPAAQAGLQKGDVIETINDRPVESWADILLALNDLTDQEVRLTYRRGQQNFTADLGRLDAAVYQPTDFEYRLFTYEIFQPLQVTIHHPNPLKAMAWGARETRDMILLSYASLRAIVRGTVSTDELHGPLGIGIIGVRVAQESSLIDFVYFIAFFSAVVAVFNFLPLPVVDGGHATLLLIEKIRGRPLPLKVMNIIQFVGLALILLLMVLLTWQDVARELKKLWF